MNLIERISKALKDVDAEADNLEHGEVPNLLKMRSHQRILTGLLRELADELKNAKRNELASYIERRRAQAGQFRKKRMVSGMTAKDCEEEAKIFAKDLWEKEVEAEAHMKHMEMLTRALVHKIYFVQDICNDVKHLVNAFHPQGA